MKRMVIVPILMLILAVMSVGTHRSVERFCTAQIADLDETVLLLDADETEAAAEKLNGLCADFAQWRGKADCFLRHSELDPVQESLTDACAYAECADWDASRVSCRQAQMNLRHVLDGDTLSWGNVG